MLMYAKPIIVFPSLRSNAFEENNFLYSYQSGFRTNHSNDLCLSFLTNKILKGFDVGLINGMISTDLSDA